MLIDSRGVIRKLDTHGVLPFLRINMKPLVFYGAGLVGREKLEMLGNLGIEVTDVVDGSREKQGQYVLGFQIKSIEDIEEKYDDYILLVSIVKEEVFLQVVKSMHERQIKGKILWLHNYCDYDEELPIIIVGMSKTGEKLQRQEKCLGYLDYRNEKLDFYNGLPMISCSQIKGKGNKYNFILCDKRDEMKMFWKLNECDVYENIYLYHSPVFGEFRPVKYKFLAYSFRNIFSPYTCVLHKIYWQLGDDNSRQIFLEACEKVFSNKYEFTLGQYMRLVEEKYSLEEAGRAGTGTRQIGFDLEELKEAYHFLYLIDKITAANLQPVLKMDKGIVFMKAGSAL